MHVHAPRRSALASLAAIGLLSIVAAVVLALTQPLGASAWVLALLPAIVAVWWGWGRRLDHMERELRDSEARNSRVLDAAPEAVISIRSSGQVVEFNAAAARMFGVTRHYAVGRPFVELVSTERRRRQLFRALKRLTSVVRATPTQIQFEVRRNDGKTFPVELTVVQTETIGDSLLTGFLRDLSARKQVERELKESEARYRSLIEHAADAIFVFDRAGAIRDVNRRACESLGYSRTELVGRRVSEIDVTSTNDTLRSGQTTTMEATHRRKDGTTFPVEVRLGVLDEDDQPLVLALARDVSSRRRAEAALRESERRFRETLETARLVAVWLDQHGHVTFCNDAFLNLTGYRRTEVLGRSLFDTIFSPEDRPTTKSKFLRGDRPGGGVGAIESNVVSKTGDRRTVAWTNTILRDPDGNIIGTSCLGEDVTERRRAEAALRKSEALFRLVWDTAADAMRLTNANGIVVAANQAYCQMIGRSAKELIGRPVGEAYGESRRAEIARKFVERFATRTVQSFYESEVELWDGRMRWFESANAFLESPGEQPLLFARLRDVTGRKQAETALRESEERFRRLFEDSPIGIYRTTPKGEYLLANPAAVRMAGCESFAELAALNLETEAPKAGYDRAAFRRRLEASGELRGLECIWRRRDGEVVYIRENARVVRAADGSVLYYEGTLEDITDRRRVEAVLCEREELLRNVINHIPGGVFWKDRHSVYLGCNDYVARMAGRQSPQVLVGLTDFDLGFDSSEAEFYRACDRQVMESGEPILNIEETQTRGDEKATLLTSKVPLRGETGQVVGILGIYQEITDRKRLEEQLRQAQKMEAVGRLAGGIAHDFNNLLTVINGFSQVVLELLNEDDATKPLVEEIGKAGERAAALTRQLLAFSRQQVVTPKVLNLNNIIGGTDRMLGRLIGEDILFSTSFAENLWPVKIDPGQVELAVMNLVVNARDAMPTGGRLTISTRNVDRSKGAPHQDVPAGDWVALSVRDTGIGMDGQTRRRLFEPFFTTKGVGKGTGLGLATVYGIVTQNGGHITVASELNRGTEFTIYFPRVIDSPLAEQKDSALNDMPRGTETILLVEDEPAVRALNRRILESTGYLVLEACDGRDAVRIVDGLDGPLHLLVSDVVMPHLGGRQLAEQLHQIRKRLKVLFVSGYTDDEIVRHGIGSDFAFLQKPFTPAELARKVREVLDRN